jgi:hypothetical protein
MKALLVFALIAWPALAHGQLDPRYAQQLADELSALELEPQCSARSATAFHCSYAARSSLERRDLTAHAHYDDTTDTVYLYIPLLTIADTAKSLPSLLHRAMELNWELLGAKLEWSAQSGELRLSAVLHTDSNFDRRAFRSLVRALDRLTLRYSVQLRQLADAPG